MSKNIKIQPLGKRVLIKPSVIEQKTAGGLVLPPDASDEKRPATGIVIALGKAKVFDMAVGDKVYFKKYSPEEIEIDNEKLLILETEDILAIIK